MKIDHQENCEYGFSLIVFDFIDFHRYYRFFSFLFYLNEKSNGQGISFVLNRRKGIQRKLLIVGAHFPLIKLLSCPCHLYFLTL